MLETDRSECNRNETKGRRIVWSVPVSQCDLVTSIFNNRRAITVVVRNLATWNTRLCYNSCYVWMRMEVEVRFKKDRNSFEDVWHDRLLPDLNPPFIVEKFPFESTFQHLRTTLLLTMSITVETGGRRLRSLCLTLISLLINWKLKNEQKVHLAEHYRRKIFGLLDSSAFHQRLLSRRFLFTRCRGEIQQVDRPWNARDMTASVFGIPPFPPITILLALFVFGRRDHRDIQLAYVQLQISYTFYMLRYLQQIFGQSEILFINSVKFSSQKSKGEGKEMFYTFYIFYFIKRNVIFHRCEERRSKWI